MMMMTMILVVELMMKKMATMKVVVITIQISEATIVESMEWAKPFRNRRKIELVEREATPRMRFCR